MIPFGIIASLKGYNFKKAGVTKSWIHFECEGGVVFSFRRLNETFPDLDKAGLFEHSGDKFKLPSGINKTLDRAGVFSKADFEQDEIVKLIIDKGELTVSASNEHSSYEETIDCESKIKAPISFEIHPKFLQECEKDATACVGPRTLSIKTKTFQYVALLTLL